MGQILLLILGTALMVVFIIMYTSAGKKYDSLFSGLEKKEHPFISFYPLGYSILEKIHFDFHSNYARKIQSDIEIVQGNKYAEFFMRVNISAKVGVGLMILPLTLLLIGGTAQPLMVILAALAIFLDIYYFDMIVQDEMKKRADEIERELPNIISKLTLLVNAGMTLRNAWVRVSNTGESTLYKEMQYSVNQMQSAGKSEEEALKIFSDRCKSQKVKKFVGTLLVNVQRGNRDLAYYLKEQSHVSWEERKEYAKQQAEYASNKLIIPTAIILIGIIIMIAVPLMSGFSF